MDGDGGAGGAEERIRVGAGGFTHNKRLTACKSCLTLELAPELSTNLKKDWGC